MKPDYAAAWEAYYRLADRRHKEGLTYAEIMEVVKAAFGICPCCGEPKKSLAEGPTE
jgi:hypothetical protein